MKVAEALLYRKELVTELETLSRQFTGNISIENGVEPRRDAVLIHNWFLAKSDILTRLIININHTNNVTIVDGVSVMRLIAERDTLKIQLPLYNTMYSGFESVVSNSRRKTWVRPSDGGAAQLVESAVVPVSTIKSPQMEHTYNAMCKRLRELDLQLQALTWQVDLIELV